MPPDVRDEGARVLEPERALRILHVTPWYAPAWRYGGLVESVRGFARSLARLGAAVRVLTTDADGRDARVSAAERAALARADRVQTRYCLRIAGESAAPGLVAALPSLVRWADLVHLHAVYSFPTIPTLACARLLGRPVVWTPHGALQRWSGSRRPAFKAAWETACRLATPRGLVLHVTSSEEGRESRGRLGETATVLVPNGVAIPDRLSPIRGNRRLRLVFIGRLDPKKGIENLLDACAILMRRAAAEFTLTIAGAGSPPYEDRLRARVSALAATGAEIAMVGEVRAECKRRLFENADVVVVPSHTENFAIVVAESLAHGVPVIASTGTPWSELETVGCGLWVANRPEALADAIERIAAMPLAAMGERGRRWMIERYSWTRCARALLACYGDLVRSGEQPQAAPAHERLGFG
jgi:glycosyltransferase involved in cell wall biosynthesis